MNGKTSIGLTAYEWSIVLEALNREAQEAASRVIRITAEEVAKHVARELGLDWGPASSEERPFEGWSTPGVPL